MVGRITDKAAMVAMYRAGKTTRQIAAAFGVQPPAVTRQLNKAGIKPKRVQPTRHDDVVAELVAEGETLNSIAVRLGICPQRASQIWQRVCRRMGEE